MHLRTAILAQGICKLCQDSAYCSPSGLKISTYFQGIELYIRIAMRQPFDHARHGVFGTAVLGADLIADIHNIFPILRRQILVGRLSYKSTALALLPELNVS